MKVGACCSSFLFLLSLLAIILHPTHALSPCTKAAIIHDHPALDQAIASARSRFLSTRPHNFTRLDSAILIPQEDGSFFRGTFNPEVINYPASCVKLFYMVGAVHWCQLNGKPNNCLDKHVRPMIGVSDNFETGVIVDYISNGAVNYKTDVADAKFEAWLKQRNFTQAFLDSKGLLENQVVEHKTFPSNSGPNPTGAEALARKTLGMNMLNPKCAASMMMEIATGKIGLNATEYFLGLLSHSRASDYTSYGMGLPPGSQLFNKIGNAYDTLEEIAYVVLPNGKWFVLATFTNGYEPTEPQLNTLSYYAETLIDRIPALNANLPPKTIYTIKNATLAGGSGWKQEFHNDAFGGECAVTTDSVSNFTATYTMSTLSEGLYEVSVWYPEGYSSFAKYTINHTQGSDTVRVNQRLNGGRWNKVGDYYLDNTSSVVLTRGDSQTLVADSVKVHQWPSCGPIPGTSC